MVLSIINIGVLFKVIFPNVISEVIPQYFIMAHAKIGEALF